jgi:type 1 glutamine amidotransferase
MSLDINDPDTKALASEEADYDTGVSWIKNRGKGRIFYTNFGHGAGQGGLGLEDDSVQEHFLLGIQWVMGNLQADATPKGTKTTTKAK